MAWTIARLTILLLVLGALALPATALAAPALTVTPTAGKGGTTFTIRGSGFAPNAKLIAFIENELGARYTDPGAIPVAVGADGTFQFDVPTPPETIPGRYTFVVTSGPNDPVLARVVATVATPHGEILTITPASGSPGTTFTLDGANFKPGDRLLYAVGGKSEEPLVGGQITIAADGRFRARVDSTGLAAGPYGVYVGYDNSGDTNLASGMFTVAGAGMPGLPNTGGGAASAGRGSAVIALCALALAGLAGGAIVRRRWRA